jgi:hypothetical protein
MKLGVKLLIVTKSNHKQYRQHSCIRIALYEVTCSRLQTTSSDQARIHLKKKGNKIYIQATSVRVLIPCSFTLHTLKLYETE